MGGIARFFHLLCVKYLDTVEVTLIALLAAINPGLEAYFSAHQLISIMFSLLNTLSTGSAVFLSFLVLTVRGDVNLGANRWLAFFLLLLGLTLFDGNVKIYGFSDEPIWLVIVFNLSFLMLAPTLYLCVSRFVAPNQQFRVRELLHFLPNLLLLTISALPLFFALEVPDQEQAVSASEWNAGDVFVITLIVLQILGYLIFSFKILLKHQKNIKNFTAAPVGFQLNWLIYFLSGIAVMVIAWLFELFFLPLEQTQSAYSIAYFIAVYSLGYFAMRQKEVFPILPEEVTEAEEILEAQNESFSTRRQRIPESKLAELKSRLLEVMKKEQPYLNPEINLSGFAKYLGLSLHELSELINIGFGENFAQFINRYRVEESKKLLVSAQHTHLTIVGIAFEAGFNSKTAFNTAFKKQVGVSPTEFQKQEKSNPEFEPNSRSILQ